MLPAAFTRCIIHGLDWLAARLLPPDPRPRHQRTGTRGEEDAYFHLRKLGYAIVARNFRTPRCRGEIDLIGWDEDVLCFIEVKTRTLHGRRARREACRGRRRPAQAARGGPSGARIPAAPTTYVPVEIRHRQRILCGFERPSAD